jgi:Xaa-Pro aminopeptidase
LHRIEVASEIADMVQKALMTIIENEILTKEEEWSETDLAAELASLLRSAIEHQDQEIYSEKPTILRVAGGCNTSLLHPEPTLKKINSGELLTYDLNPVYKGYHCVEIDTIGLGKDGLRNEYRKAYDLASAALNTAVDLMSTGAVCKEIYSESEKPLSEYPHSYFNGSPIGLEIHEPPYANMDYIYPNGENLLKENSVYTLFAGVFKPGKWGVRLAYTVKVAPKKGVIIGSP